jgi:hypothetical protein
MTRDELTQLYLSIFEEIFADFVKAFDREHPGIEPVRRAFVLSGTRAQMLRDIRSGRAGRRLLEWAHRHYQTPTDLASYADLDDFMESIIKARGRYHAGGN